MTTPDYEPRPLPPEALDLCDRLTAPPALVAQLQVVHDAACGLLAGLDERFSELPLDRRAVLFGAATHDLGQVRHLHEIGRPGRRHEQAGPALLEAHGVATDLARFARTHGTWKEDDDLALEDLLVALAAVAWNGDREAELEMLAAERIAERTGDDEVGAFVALDELLEALSLDAESRIAWRRRIAE
ncbi:MAG TPA: hypothetical protein VGE52_16755 [Pirellulales bacterium]